MINEKLSNAQCLLFVNSLRSITPVGVVSRGHNVIPTPERERLRGR